MQSRIFVRSRATAVKLLEQSWTARSRINFTAPSLFTTFKHYSHDHKFIDTSKDIEMPNNNLGNPMLGDNHIDSFFGDIPKTGDNQIDSFFGDIPKTEPKKMNLTPNPNYNATNSLIHYLDSAQSLSNKLYYLHNFSIKMKGKVQSSSESNHVVGTSGQQPLVPLVLIRNVIFECKTLQELLLISRSLKPQYMVPGSEARHELACSMLLQFCHIYQNNPSMFTTENLTPEFVSDCFNFLNFCRYQGVKKSSLSPETSRLVWEMIKCLHSSPLDFSKASNMLQNMTVFWGCCPSKPKAIEMIEAAFIQNHKLATANQNITSTQASLALFGIRLLQEAHSFHFSAAMNPIIKSLAETVLASVDKLQESGSLDSKAAVVATDFQQVLLNLNLLKFRSVEDTPNFWEKVLLATQKMTPYFSDEHLSQALTNLGELSFTAKDLQKSTPRLIQVFDDRMEQMTPENFSYLLFALNGLQFSLASETTGEKRPSLDRNKYLSKFESCLKSSEMKSERVFSRCIFAFKHLGVAWDMVPRSGQEAFAQCVVQMLPNISWGQIRQFMSTMGYWEVHYPLLKAFDFEPHFLAMQTSSPGKFAKWNREEVWSLLSSLAKMNCHWPSSSPEMQRFFYDAIVNVCQNVALPYPTRLTFFAECIKSLGTMHEKWTNLPPEVQIHLMSLMENMDIDTLQEAIHPENIAQMRKDAFVLVRGCGLVSFPFAPFVECVWPLVNTVILHPANRTIEAQTQSERNQSVETVVLCHGLGNLEGASWDVAPESMIEMLRQLGQKITAVNDKALAVMCFTTVKLAFDCSLFRRKDKSVASSSSSSSSSSSLSQSFDRRQQMLDLTHVLLKEVVSRLQSGHSEQSVNRYAMFLLFVQRLMQQKSSSLNHHPLKQLWEHHRPLFLSTLQQVSENKQPTLLRDDGMDFELFHTISPFHAKVSSMLKTLLIEKQAPTKDIKYKIVDEFEGLKCESVPLAGYPVDIAVFGMKEDGQEEPLLFVEIDGMRHYLPVDTADQTNIFQNNGLEDEEDKDATDEDSQDKQQQRQGRSAEVKLRRVDQMKEHFYRDLYPNVPIFRCSVEGNFESYVVKHKILPLVWEQTDLFRGGSSKRKYVRKAAPAQKDAVNFRTDEKTLLVDCDGATVRRKVLTPKEIYEQFANFEEEEEDEELEKQKLKETKKATKSTRTRKSAKKVEEEQQSKDSHGDKVHIEEEKMTDEQVFTAMVLEEGQKKKKKTAAVSTTSTDAASPEKKKQSRKPKSSGDEEASSTTKQKKSKKSKDVSIDNGDTPKFKLNI